MTPTTQVSQAWPPFIHEEEVKELEQIITLEKLDPEKTRKLVNEAYQRGNIPETGTAVSKLLPPASRFTKGGNPQDKRRTVIDKLKAHLERFLGMVGR